jgi:macrolide transport system ATP-binding/permease protein
MSWLGRLFGRKRMEIELDRELRFHLEAQVADKVRAGIPESEARRLTRLEFGGIEQTKEACRQPRGTLWLESIVRDVLYGLRRLRKSPAFSCVVILTLALGLGANTAIFSLVQGILLHSLPVADPASLYRIGDRTTCCYNDGFESDDGDFDLFSYDLFRQFQQATPEFEQLAAVQAAGQTYTARWGASPARSMRTEYVSGNYFTTFGVNAFTGRSLSPSDDRAGATPVVVLSYSAWQGVFGGNPNVVVQPSTLISTPSRWQALRRLDSTAIASRRFRPTCGCRWPPNRSWRGRMPLDYNLT